MLKLERYDGVQDPVVSQDGIDDHGGVVPPHLLVPELFSQKRVLGVRVAQTPIVVDIPEAGVDAVDDSERDVNCLGGGSAVHAMNAQCRVEQDSGSVFSAV